MTCVFDIKPTKSFEYGSQGSLGPHILTQFDEICRLGYDMTIFDEIFFWQFFTSDDPYHEKLPNNISIWIWSNHTPIDRSRQIE